MFGDIFGQQRQQRGPQRGPDVRFDYEITLEQAYKGAEVDIVVPTTMTCEACHGSGAKAGTKPSTCMTCGGQGRVRSTNGFFAVERTCPHCNGQGTMIKDPCPDCRGHGQVRQNKPLKIRIPAGIDDGARIRVNGEGQAGQKGGPKGDLYIFLSVAEHDIFERDGLDLHCSIPVPMPTAVLGGVLDVPCLMGGGQLRRPVQAGDRRARRRPDRPQAQAEGPRHARPQQPAKKATSSSSCSSKRRRTSTPARRS